MADSWSGDSLRSLLEHTQDIIIVVDEGGRISFVNTAIHDLLGYDPGEMVGMNAFEFIHAGDRSEVFDRFIDMIGNPNTATDRVQHRMVHRDGRNIWVESIGSSQTDTDLDGYVINTRDISEIKAYEAELERQIERLDEFASVVSHDLGIP